MKININLNNKLKLFIIDNRWHILLLFMLNCLLFFFLIYYHNYNTVSQAKKIAVYNTNSNFEDRHSSIDIYLHPKKDSLVHNFRGIVWNNLNNTHVKTKAHLKNQIWANHDIEIKHINLGDIDDSIEFKQTKISNKNEWETTEYNINKPRNTRIWTTDVVFGNFLDIRKAYVRSVFYLKICEDHEYYDADSKEFKINIFSAYDLGALQFTPTPDYKSSYEIRYYTKDKILEINNKGLQISGYNDYFLNVKNYNNFILSVTIGAFISFIISLIISILDRNIKKRR